VPTDINRHRLKQSYQPNMLKAQFILVVLVGIAVGAYYFSIRDHDAIVRQPHKINSSLMLNDSGALENELVRTTPRPVPSLNPYTARHDGFLGFIRLEPTVAVPEQVKISQSLFSDELELAELTSEPILSNSLNQEADTGGYQVAEFEASEFLPQLKTVPPPILAAREIQVVNRVDPEYPWYAKENGKEGKITVLIYIDSTGALSTFPNWIAGEGIKTVEYTVDGESRTANYAFQEDPPEWFFARSFIKVLPEWKFAPRIENGRPVGSLFRIKYTFCLGVNCLKYEFEQLATN